MQEAVECGYEALVIDSLSHAWAGDGGLLAKKEALDARGGNPFSNWAAITKEHEALKSALLQAPIHILATMRSKTEYAMQEDRNGKAVPRKVGLAPIQRDGIEYEFSTVFDLTMDHTAMTTKDRTGLFDGLAEVLTEKHGQRLRQWLAGGAEPEPKLAPRKEPAASPRMEAAAEPEPRPEPPSPPAPPPTAAGDESPGTRVPRNGGAAGAWTGPGQCPGCKAPEGKRHATSCTHYPVAKAA